MDCKNKSQILNMIFAIVNVPDFNISFGDSKYILSNLIAKYSNCGKIRISKRAKEILNEHSILTDREIKYLYNFYGKNCSFYKKYGIQFVIEHVIVCGEILENILRSDKRKTTIKSILDHNFVAMVTKDEDDTIRSLKYHNRMPDGYQLGMDPLGRYDAVGIQLSDSYFINSGKIFR